MTTIAAELSLTGDQIVLVAGGREDAPEEVAQAARTLQLLTPLFSKTTPPGGLTVPATWPAVVQLSAAFGPAWHPGPRLIEWIQGEAALRSVQGPPGLAYRAPDGLTPYPWQTEGARMIAATGKTLITDEPGTGKTITAILGVVERARAFSDKSTFPLGVIVVCPNSVVDPWVEAWQTWAPHLTAVAWRGTPKQRAKLAGAADVYVTSYETARQDAPPRNTGPLAALGAKHLVIDECHLIKNHLALRSQAVRRLAKRAETVVALSGTPITHHPGDLWPTLAALEHDAWPSRQRWIDRYCQTLTGDYSEQVLGLEPTREAEFRTTLLGQQRRVAKADVLDQLPPKIYSIRTVELPAKWRKAYDDMEAQMLAELPDGSEISVMSVLAQLTRLSQLASAAAHVEVDHDPETGTDHTKVTLQAPSWKVDALLEVLAERPGEPVVAFAPSKQLIKIAGEAATEAGYRVGYITGDVKGSDRTEAIAKFQAGDLDLICVTTGAGGVGITLTAAKTAVFLQRPWSLVESIQAEDRCHRIGSEIHDAVEIIDIVAKNTLDTRVRAVLRERGKQLADLVQDQRIVTELLGGRSVTRSAA